MMKSESMMARSMPMAEPMMATADMHQAEHLVMEDVERMAPEMEDGFARSKGPAEKMVACQECSSAMEMYKFRQSLKR